MDTLQFSLFFSALLVAYVLVHIRLSRFEQHVKQLSVLDVLNNRLKQLVDGLGAIRVDHLEEGLSQLHTDLQKLHDLQQHIERGHAAARDAQPTAKESAAANAADRIRSAVEERLLQLGYRRLRILTDLSAAGLDVATQIAVEAERRDMPYKGSVTTINGTISDVQMHSVVQTFP